MTPQEPAIATAPQYRFAGWAAITSGMIGFFAYAALMTGVFSRLSGGEERFWTLLFRSRDAGAVPEAPDSTANGIIHIVLMLGSFMGVLTFPIWSALVGRRLLRQRSS